LPIPAAHVLPDAPARQSETPAPSFERGAASPTAKLSIDPQHAMRFGPYAETYRPDSTPPATHMAAHTRRPPASASPEADATSNAANSNTARTAPIVPPPSRTTATVVAMPRAQHYAQANNETSQPSRDPALARVTLQRETATITIPVSDPDSLNRRQETDVIDAEPVQAAAPARQEPPRLAQDQLSAEDRAFIRRIALPAAE
jgi:hypothetical protein